MTNRDVLNKMSNWDFAEFLRKVSDGETKITTCGGECADCEMSEGYCSMCIGEWLISEAEDAEV